MEPAIGLDKGIELPDFGFNGFYSKLNDDLPPARIGIRILDEPRHLPITDRPGRPADGPDLPSSIRKFDNAEEWIIRLDRQIQFRLIFLVGVGRMKQRRGRRQINRLLVQRAGLGQGEIADLRQHGCRQCSAASSYEFPARGSQPGFARLPCPMAWQ